MSDVPGCIGKFYNAQANTARAGIGDADREQDVCTPESVLIVPRKVFGFINLDPCHSPSSLVGARHMYYVPERRRPAPTKKQPNRTIPYYEADASLGEVDGLVAPWMDGTFFNPPFRELGDWLIKAMLEARNGYEIIGLFPVRPSRVWWRAAKRSATRTLWMDPLAFVGEDSTFPQALCLMYWGDKPATFELASEHLGEIDV